MLRNKKSQSLATWALVVGATATVILSTQVMVKRITQDKIEQMSNLALWTEQGPSQWYENVFDAQGNWVGAVNHTDCVSLHYKDNDTTALDITHSMAKSNTHEYQGTITYDSDVRVDSNSNQTIAGDGFEDWLPD